MSYLGLIVGVTGRARAGKNTVAHGLISGAAKSGQTARVYEFSQYVIKDLNPSWKEVPREDLLPEEISKLVSHGLEKRKKDPWYWVDRVFSDIVKDKPDVAILPNIRFLNEAEAVKNYGYPGVIIRVKTFVKDGIEYISTDRDPNDDMETENQLIQADYFLTVARGQTKLLKMQAESLYEYLKKEAYN